MNEMFLLIASVCTVRTSLVSMDRVQEIQRKCAAEIISCYTSKIPGKGVYTAMADCLSHDSDK